MCRRCFSTHDRLPARGSTSILLSRPSSKLRYIICASNYSHLPHNIHHSAPLLFIRRRRGNNNLFLHRVYKKFSIFPYFLSDGRPALRAGDYTHPRTGAPLFDKVGIARFFQVVFVSCRWQASIYSYKVGIVNTEKKYSGVQHERVTETCSLTQRVVFQSGFCTAAVVSDFYSSYRSSQFIPLERGMINRACTLPPPEFYRSLLH